MVYIIILLPLFFHVARICMYIELEIDHACIAQASVTRLLRMRVARANTAGRGKWHI